MTLAELPDGARAEVVEISEQCRGFSRSRLLDLGLTPGVKVQAEKTNIFGDPRAFRIRGTVVALRRELAAQIRIRPVPTEPASEKEARGVSHGDQA